VKDHSQDTTDLEKCLKEIPQQVPIFFFYNRNFFFFSFLFNTHQKKTAGESVGDWWNWWKLYTGTVKLELTFLVQQIENDISVSKERDLLGTNRSAPHLLSRRNVCWFNPSWKSRSSNLHSGLEMGSQ
jgi:hypothetical protein